MIPIAAVEQVVNLTEQPRTRDGNEWIGIFYALLFWPIGPIADNSEIS